MVYLLLAMLQYFAEEQVAHRDPPQMPASVIKQILQACRLPLRDETLSCAPNSKCSRSSKLLAGEHVFSRHQRSLDAHHGLPPRLGSVQTLSLRKNNH